MNPHIINIHLSGYKEKGNSRMNIRKNHYCRTVLLIIMNLQKTKSNEKLICSLHRKVLEGRTGEERIKNSILYLTLFVLY